jgi:uncharacterized protein (TIGR02757 family)
LKHRFNQKIYDLLEEKYNSYSKTSFIDDDPISIPHQYSKLQDIEITAFWTAILSWGQRKTIINKSKELFALMDNAPHDFILNHSEKDLIRFKDFKHRTFNFDDTLCFIYFLKFHYSHNDSLETAFLNENKFSSIDQSLNHFKNYFFSDIKYLDRTKKHISSPNRKSTCKRLNMFLRWMVRKDNNNVDFGIWKKIKPSDLKIPFDVHVDRVARQLKLLERKQKDWQTVLELTNTLAIYDGTDPVKYDYALFGMGVLKDEDIF